jgi:hypothetical protein
MREQTEGPNMTLKLIGAGFGRTGTLSTRTALEELGFPCYHMVEVVENKDNKTHMDFWCKVADSTPGAEHDWESVFSKYTAAVDNPACCVWKELLAAYPDAKVLLTLHPRGAEGWYESAYETIYFTERVWQFKVIAALVPKLGKLGRMTRKLVWERNHKGTMKSKKTAIAYYDEYAQDVIASVPKERLLVFSVDQGWGPLCKFLDLPEPSTPFPRVNDREQIKKLIHGLMMGGYITVGLGAAIAVVLVFALVRLLG